MAWNTRTWVTKNDIANYTEVLYQCMPTNVDNEPYVAKDYNDKEIKCIAGPYVPKPREDRVDWCRMKVWVKIWDKKFNYGENKDGKVNDHANRGGDDKWRFEDDPGDQQKCEWDKEKTVIGFNNDSTTFKPVLAWTKPLVPDDKNKDNDNKLMFTDNLTLYWETKGKDKQYRGSFEGFYIDDPHNSALIKSGAKLFAAGFASVAAVYATLA